MPRIHRCVCTNTSFTALLATARSHGLTLRELAKRTGASRQCGRCAPYLRRMMRTGQTEFHTLLSGDDEPAQPPENGPRP